MLYSANETETNEKDVVEEEVTSGVTNINMEDGIDDDKKKARRRPKKKENKEKESHSKGNKQTNPPSVPIHVLYPTSEYCSSLSFNTILLFLLFIFKLKTL